VVFDEKQGDKTEVKSGAYPLRLKGLPLDNIFSGILAFHFFKNGRSSFSLRSSSGSISGISSRIGYQRKHLGQTIKPSVISSFSSNILSSSG
jgi:hypothetical protein